MPGITLHTLRWGDPQASPLVLLHGGGANAHWWEHLAPTFATSFQVVALDFRGHGDSTFPDELEVGAFNADLEALTVRLSPQAPILIGHSMGAHVALDHAARHTDVRGLVLIDPARGGTKRSRRTARLALALRRTYATEREAIERFRFVPSADHCEEALRRRIAAWSVRQEPDGAFGFKFDPRWFGVPARPKPDASAVACPTLILRGEESEILSSAGATDLAEEIPNAQVATIDGAGHHVLLDQPERMLDTLVPWLLELA